VVILPQVLLRLKPKTVESIAAFSGTAVHNGEQVIAGVNLWIF